MSFENFYYIRKDPRKQWQAQKDSLTIKEAVDQFLSSCKPTVYIRNTIWMDKTTCLWKRFKWNKTSFYGERLSEKINYVVYHPPRACLRKLFDWNELPKKRWIVWRKYSSGTSSLDKDRSCLRNLICLLFFHSGLNCQSRKIPNIELVNFTQKL